MNQLERHHRALVELDDALSNIAHSMESDDLDEVMMTLLHIAGSIAIARGRLISMRPMLIVDERVQEGVEEARRLASAALPDPQPQPGRKVKSKDVSCPTCKAKPGKPCVEMTKRGRYGEPTDIPVTKGSHKPRVAKAKEAS